MSVHPQSFFLRILIFACLSLIASVHVLSVFAEETPSDAVVPEEVSPVNEEVVPPIAVPEIIPEEVSPVPESINGVPTETPVDTEVPVVSELPDGPPAQIDSSGDTTMETTESSGDDISAPTDSETDVEYETEAVTPIADELTQDGSFIMLHSMSEGTTTFALSDQISFTLTSDTPFHERKKEPSQDGGASFVETVAEVTESFITEVVEMAHEVIETISEVVVTVAEEIGLSADGEQDAVTASTEASVMEDESVSEGVPVTSEDTSAKLAVEELDTQARIDGVPTAVSVSFVDDYSVVVTFDTSKIEPGVHTVHIAFTIAGTTFMWEGTCLWGGTIVYSREVGSGVWAIVLEDREGSSGLFIQEYDGSVFTYTILDDSFVFAQALNITVFENTLFWLSLGKDVLHGYDFLSRTQFSQSLDSAGETQIVLHEQIYRTSTRTAEPHFTSEITTAE